VDFLSVLSILHCNTRRFFKRRDRFAQATTGPRLD
jgi:hypothetical protein